ncbi:MAG TPA: porin family protein [Niabella sp.]|nr:porin family protein [Niabella sp.]
MKTVKLLFLVCFLMISGAIFAQVHPGIKAGLNATKIDGKSMAKEFQYYYLVGGFIELEFGKRFGITPEVLFNQASTSLATNVDPGIFNTNQAKAKLNYLSIPILADIKLAGPLHLQAGPQYSILLNSDESIFKNGENAFKKGDFSLAAGLKIKASIFRLSARYLVGLDNINQINNQEKWKKQEMQLTVGLGF